MGESNLVGLCHWDAIVPGKVTHGLEFCSANRATITRG